MMISLMKITHPCLDDDDQENDDEDSWPHEALMKEILYPSAEKCGGFVTLETCTKYFM